MTIRRVWSDLASFREVFFAAGMNVVLADRAADSEETESTNGLGKTTLLRIIHFCLGSDLARDKVLSHPDLGNVTFCLDFEHGGATYTVRRNTSTAKVVIVDKAFVEGLSFEYEPKSEKQVELALDVWKLVLSKRFYPETET